MTQFLPATVSPKTTQSTITSGAIAVALVAAVWVLDVTTVRIGIDDLDEGYFVAQATRVLHGQVPYRDFETLYAPGLLYVHAAVIALTGLPLLGPRLLALIARAAIAALLFVLTRPLVRNPIWAAAPALVLLVGLDDAPVRWEPHPGWLSTFFALFAIWMVAHGRSSRWLMAGGVAAATTFAFKQNTGLLMLGAILLWSAGHRPAVPLIAFLATTLLWLLPLIAVLRGDASSLGVLVGSINQAGLWSGPEPTILIPLGCLALGAWLMRHESDARVRWYFLSGIALALTEFPRMDTIHLAWSAPLLLVVAAVALDRLTRVTSAFAIAATLILLAPNMSRVTYFTEPRTPVDGVEAITATASDINGVVADIDQRTRPGEPIFVYPTSPLLYVLADRPNPTRFDHLNPGAASPAQIDQVIANLQRSNVAVIVISDFWMAAWDEEGPGNNGPLEAWLTTHFTEVARHGSYRVLASDL